jgi:TIR domain
MKVFLSHSTKDQQFVQALAAKLKAEKIEQWICDVDVEFDGNFVAKIEEGLRDADLTVLFWSPEAARSGWTQLEWISMTAREISESRTRLGVVLLGDCEAPQLLRVKHRIDARSDPEKARQETINWIKRLRDMRRQDSMATGDDAKIMLSDHGSNDRLLAHELGHAMGLLHPAVMPYIPNNSIVQPTGAGKTNPDLVTDKMCRVLTWPAKLDEKCWHVDPDNKATFDKP